MNDSCSSTRRCTHPGTLWLAPLRFLALALCALATATAAFADDGPKRSGEGFDVESYALRLVPDIDAGTIAGEQHITLQVIAEDLDTLAFDAGDLVVGRVRMDGAELAFQRDARTLRVRLPAPARAGDRIELEIGYAGRPAHGLQFHPARREIYTIFSTSQWMVAVDAPSERAAFELELVVPRDLRVAGNGAPLAQVDVEPDLRAHRWRMSEAAPSFVYGFAAGPYRQASEQVGTTTLHYLSIDQDEAQLRRTFADTRHMLRFFERRAGFAYRGDYTQALVASTVGQEMAGLAVLSERYGAQVLDHPQNRALIAHEVAHQWWGVAITCRDWGHFWLNEGFANFMAAAWLEDRFGADAYRAQVAGWEQRLASLRERGADRGLVYERWFRPSADDRAIVYQKGAYVLHRLRLHLGERAFWRGIRDYTREYRGRSVTTLDFRRAMERSSRRDLGEFFARWVDGPSR